MRLFTQLLITSNFRRFLCFETLEKGVTIRDAISHWTNVFKKEHVPEPKCSAENIMAHVLNFKKVSQVYEISDKILTENETKYLEKCCDCRIARMPVQYIIREWDFRKLNLIMTPPVFIPRPETEELVDIVLDYLKKNKLSTKHFLEVGCGTGAIVLSLLCELKEVSQAYAVDRSNMACLLTTANARVIHEGRIIVINGELDENGTINLRENGTNPLDDTEFDFIVSNPPYVPYKKLRDLEPEIKVYEDLRALDGGDDGMKIIKPLMIYSSNKLVNNGSLFIEIDETQPRLIKEWIETNYDRYKLKLVKVYKDFCKKDRFVHIIKEC